jgi:pyridoxine 5'-phosphate synthase PdxJ
MQLPQRGAHILVEVHGGHGSITITSTHRHSEIVGSISATLSRAVIVGIDQAVREMKQLLIKRENHPFQGQGSRRFYRLVPLTLEREL